LSADTIEKHILYTHLSSKSKSIKNNKINSVTIPESLIIDETPQTTLVSPVVTNIMPEQQPILPLPIPAAKNVATRPRQEELVLRRERLKIEQAELEIAQEGLELKKRALKIMKEQFELQVLQDRQN
jgi:hypothetical protein